MKAVFVLLLCCCCCAYRLRCPFTWTPASNDWRKDLPIDWKKPDIAIVSFISPCGISLAPPETASSCTCDVSAVGDFGGEAFESNVLKTLYVFIISPDGACEGRQEGEVKRGRGEEV